MDGQGGSTRSGPLPVWLRWYDNGVLLTNYLDTSPVPQSGLLATLADLAHAAGYDEVEIFTRSLSAQEIRTTGQYAREVLGDVRALPTPDASRECHLFLMSAMTNDAQSTAEVDIWADYITQLWSAIETYHPETRAFLLEAPVQGPSGPSGGHAAIDYAKSEGARIMAMQPYRGYVESDGLDLGVDQVHLEDTGYDEWAARVWALYAVTP